jgi:hypothetical protein
MAASNVGDLTGWVDARWEWPLWRPVSISLGVADANLVFLRSPHPRR